MHVLQVHTRYRQAGGEDAVVAAEAALLRAAGHRVTCHTAENPLGAVNAAAALALAPWNPAARAAVARRAESARPDVAHVHNTWFALSPAILPGLRVPVVMTLHNYRVTCANGLLYRDGRPCTDCVGTSAWQGLVHRCYRGSAAASAVAASTVALHRARGTWARDVDLFLALSEFARERVVAAGLPAERVIVRDNFVADPGPRAAPPSRSGTVVFAGRLAPEKGVDRLLGAWALVRPAGLELVVAGDGPERAALERQAPGGVRFLGRVPPERVRELLGTARALVFPSRWYEGQPVTILEACAAGLPVLASDLGGAGELVRATAGWPVTDWAEALGRLGDGAALDEAGAAGRRAYEARFTEAVALRTLEDAYARVVA